MASYRSPRYAAPLPPPQHAAEAGQADFTVSPGAIAPSIPGTWHRKTNLPTPGRWIASRTSS